MPTPRLSLLNQPSGGGTTDWVTVYVWLVGELGTVTEHVPSATVGQLSTTVPAAFLTVNTTPAGPPVTVVPAAPE